MTTTSEHTGTARYMAPELVVSEVSVHPTLASDLYALGCIGFEIIYLEKPYSNRMNNIRGQIFQDIRRGHPPAIELPHYQWPSRRLWPFVANIWNKDPILRPSAFVTVDMLSRATFTFPPAVMKRIIEFAMMLPSLSYLMPIRAWKAQCTHLRSLGAVSKLCWMWVTPELYKKIKLDSRKSISALLKTLNESRTTPLQIVGVHSGYGAHTRTLKVAIPLFQIYFKNETLRDIRDLVRMMVGIRTILICDITTPHSEIPYPSLSSLTTIHIHGLDMDLLLMHPASLQILSCLQRLYLTNCYPMLGRTAEQIIVLPGLQEITIIDEAPTAMVPQTLYMLSHWILPHLKTFNYVIQSSHPFQEPRVMDFFRKHGNILQHLTLVLKEAKQLPMQAVMAFCPRLRSIILSGYEIMLPSDTIEQIRFKCILDSPQAATDQLEHFRRFKRVAQDSFPALIDISVNWAYMAYFPEMEVKPPAYTIRTASASCRTDGDCVTVYFGDVSYRLNDASGDVGDLWPPADLSTVDSSISRAAEIWSEV